MESIYEDLPLTPSKDLNKINRRKKRDVDLSISMSSETRLRLNETSLHPSLIDTMDIFTDYKQSVSSSDIFNEEAVKDTTQYLYSEFAEVLQDHMEGNELVNVAAELARCCFDALLLIKNLKGNLKVYKHEEAELIEKERNTWRLIYALYQNRLLPPQDDIIDYMGTSEKLCIDRLFKRESLLRESQLIVDWLERNALDREDPILQQSDWTYGWEHTLHQLVAPESIAIGSNTQIIKSIHPDAPQLENLSLHHLDADNEKKLCCRMFADIRSGNLGAAQELCYNSGHPWRAAMLEGWKLYHNPYERNDELLDGDDSVMSTEVSDESIYIDIEGNPQRDLWKSSAMEYCKKQNLNCHEKAAIASLCGYLDAILPICDSWEDYLWAYMRTMVDIKVESEIRDTIIKNYKPLPQEYWEQKLSLDEIFKVLESSKNSTVRIEASQQDHVIQKYIILDEIPTLIQYLEQWTEDTSISTHSLRFYAHLVLFFNNIGDSGNRRKCENILKAYVHRLGEMNETRWVAFYVSKLARKKQVIIYASYLEKILDNEERKLALSYAEDYNLDRFTITKTVVENIRDRPDDEESPLNLQGKLTELDKIKISSLDWLLFYEEQRFEAIIQVNTTIFKFLTLRKLDAAQLSLNKIPLEYVEEIKSAESTPLSKQVLNEFLSYKAYLDAHEAFNNWFKELKSKPLPPDDISETASFTEKLVQKHKIGKFEADTKLWKLNVAEAAKIAKSFLYNVILFPGGWLTGSTDADYLRSVCIPEVIILLYSILKESNMHEEAVQLADLIGSERYSLYKVYSKEKLGEILEKICESSVALLHSKKDPWGNSSVA